LALPSPSGVLDLLPALASLAREADRHVGSVVEHLRIVTDRALDGLLQITSRRSTPSAVASPGPHRAPMPQRRGVDAEYRGRARDLHARRCVAGLRGLNPSSLPRSAVRCAHPGQASSPEALMAVADETIRGWRACRAER
jgi:hypothetical protein